MAEIKNIIFDFGGVLLNLDYQRTFDELGQLMGHNLSLTDMPADMQEVYLRYERGELQSENFMWHIQKLAKRQITQPHKIIKAWNAMLLGWNADRLPWLLSLRERYQVYLLSNTNDLHIKWVHKDLKQQHNITDFECTYFDNVYYSHEVGMQKPTAAIYELVLSDNDLSAAETIFVDDNAANVAAAAALGITAIQHDPSTEIMEQLPGYLAEASF